MSMGSPLGISGHHHGGSFHRPSQGAPGVPWYSQKTTGAKNAFLLQLTRAEPPGSYYAGPEGEKRTVAVVGEKQDGRFPSPRKIAFMEKDKLVQPWMQTSGRRQA